MGYRLNLEDRNTVSILYLYRSKTYTSADIDTTDTWIDPSPSTGAKKKCGPHETTKSYSSLYIHLSLSPKVSEYGVITSTIKGLTTLSDKCVLFHPIRLY